MWHIVYLTRNLINEKIYVGKHSTWNLDDGYLGSGNKIVRSIKKYGPDNFERIILHYCLSSDHALELERMIVDEQFIRRSDTYNLKRGGDGGASFGRVLSEETKEKIRSKAIGRKHSNESKKKMSNTRKGNIAWNKGKPMSDDQKRKLSESNKGKPNYAMRKPKTEEHKRKLSEKLKGRKPWNTGIKRNSST